jgi:hypothetical protein
MRVGVREWELVDLQIIGVSFGRIFVFDNGCRDAGCSSEGHGQRGCGRLAGFLAIGMDVILVSWHEDGDGEAGSGG